MNALGKIMLRPWSTEELFMTQNEWWNGPIHPAVVAVHVGLQGCFPEVMMGLQAWWGVTIWRADLDPSDPFLLNFNQVVFFLGLGFLSRTWEYDGYWRSETPKYGED